MNVKNSLALFVNNINLSFKAMLYRLIVVVIFTTLMYLVVNLNLSFIVRSEEMKAFIDSIKATVASFLSARMSDVGVNLVDSFKALMAYVGEHISSVIWVTIGVLALAWLENVFLGLSHFAMTKVVDAHMASLTKLGFMEALLSTLKVSVPFEVIYSLVKLLVVTLTVFICGLFVVFTAVALTFLSLVIAMWLLIFIIATFLNVTAILRPSVINGVKAKDVLKVKTSKRQYWQNLATFVVAFTVAITINVLTMATTFGAGLMISLPLTTLYFVCLKLVIYYNRNSRKFYIDIDNIVTPVSLREDGDLLDKVDVE